MDFIVIAFFIVVLPILFYIFYVLPLHHLFMSSCFGFVFSFFQLLSRAFIFL